MTPAEFEASQQTLRAGLLNAYLAPYRYASSAAESKGIAWMYERLLGLPPAVAAWPQAAFNALAKPLLYDGASMSADSARAAELYERYFDTPIQRGERTAIARALSATHDRDQRESGLVNIDQRKVRVAEQRVRVEPQGGGLARITLDETYVNLTTEPQEIFYLFSLPESAAVTGLWLGNSPDAMLPHQLSPRGAAQRVYKTEVNKRIDPALLEQVGPRQYRLRAFPVPPRVRTGRGAAAADGTAVQKLYLRLQYTALATSQAGGRAWPLPVLGEKRNVAFDQATERRCDAGPCPSDGVHWWPADLPGPQPEAPAAHAFHLAVAGRTVVARPVDADTAAPRGKNILLVVDRSRSMAAHREALLASLREARRQMAGNTVSVLLTTTEAMGPQPPLLVPLDRLDEALAATTMGGGKVDDLLRQVQQHAPAGLDLTLVLTDAGAFDLQARQADPQPRGGMLSFVHLGGALSPVYDDATLQAVQSSGGSSFTSLHEAWRHFASVQQSAPGFLMRRDGHDFSVAGDKGADKGTNTTADTQADNGPDTGTRRPVDDPTFAAIAARLFIADAARHGRANGPGQLDTLHALARAHDVVTPYSSMIVLVNDEQRRALEQAQQASDRFDRAHEQGTEQLPRPHNPLSVSATPEPGEWLMLLVSGCAVLWMIRARRRGSLVPVAAC
jgi:putative PEP-CTERM system integral membrane protein